MSAGRRRAYHPKTTQVLTHGKSRSDFRKHVADQKSLRPFCGTYPVRGPSRPYNDAHLALTPGVRLGVYEVIATT